MKRSRSLAALPMAMLGLLGRCDSPALVQQQETPIAIPLSTVTTPQSTAYVVAPTPCLSPPRCPMRQTCCWTHLSRPAAGLSWTSLETAALTSWPVPCRLSWCNPQDG